MSNFMGNRGKLFTIVMLNVFILSGAHAFNIQVLKLGSLLLFLGIILCADKKYFLPLMLFYLPWSPILKVAPGSFTFYTLVVPMVFVIFIASGLMNGTKYKLSLFILPLIFIMYTLFIKLLNGFSPDRGFLFFAVMLLFLPLYTFVYRNKINFEACVLFLVGGVITACASSKILMNFPHMLQYINVYEWERMGLTRLSGFYGDSNFYAAHILIAIGVLLITFSRAKTTKSIAIHILLILALIYFGMLSVSKMFILCLATMLILWGIFFLFEKKDYVLKIKVIIPLLLFIGFAAVSNLFSDQIDQYLIRFNLATDSDSFTTGRSSLFEMYLDYLLSGVDRLFLGIGLTSQYVNGRSSHNTFIQLIYQVGIIGVTIVVAWWSVVYANLKNKMKMRVIDILYFSILIMACFFPWLALEMLYFDEFFYLTLLVLVAKRYLADSPAT